MQMDTAVANNTAAPVSAPVTPSTPPAGETPPSSGTGGASDPFSVDEAKLATFTPEQRATLEEWKTRAKGEIEKTGKTYEEKYRPSEEKARALDALVKDSRFVQWWHGVQQSAATANPQSSNVIQSTQPQDIASAEEWQTAIAEAYAGDPSKMKMIQARMFSVMATPVIQQLRDGQAELKTTLEMKNLFEMHPDAKKLDAIGYDATNPDSPTLLETALNLSEKQGKSLEWGYQLAKRWADAMSVQAKQEAMGMVQDKKASVTSGPSTNKGGATNVVEVADVDEMMQKAQEHALDHPGQPIPKFVIRPPGQAVTTQRWAQRT
jgi:hypothetical protein